MSISKSKYMSFNTCPKLLWLLLNKPEYKVDDPKALKHIEDGKVVGSYAKLYFDNVIDVTSFKDNGELDIENMIGLTNRYLSEDVVIAEASFSINDLFCSIDLLKPVEDGYDIYEVKATTGVEKEHYVDASFQKYVLEKRGLKVNKVYILHLNKNYMRHGDIDVSQLFIKDEVTLHPEFINAYNKIKDNIDVINSLSRQKSEPSIDLSTSCKECPFSSYCTKDLPNPNVLSLCGNVKGGDYKNKYDLLKDNIVTFNDVINSGIKLSKFQKNQIDSYLNNKDKIFDIDNIKEFLSTIRYPLYHLDFESIQPPIPPSDNCWPYEQIPTQYSLHIEYEDGRLEHKEFLGDSIDPRREIAKSLCENIPLGSCVLVYNKTFESTRLKELADLYPEYREHLLDINDNIVDLEDPFKSGDYYDKKMENRYSIKFVLPALCGNDKEIDYHSLPVVHNGGEAMDIYPKMLKASKEEKERIRDGLLKYCCLDTLAMVKVLQALKKEVK